MKIILTTAPRSDIAIFRTKLPPLGLAYLASVLLKNGYQVKITDPLIERISDNTAANKIVKENPDIVGITASTHNRFQAIAMIKELKKQGKMKILVGGPHFSLCARDVLEKVPEIDVVVKGEAEETIIEVIEHLKDRASLKNIAGISYRDVTGEIIENPWRPFHENLDKIPFPAWQLFNIEKYTQTLERTDIRTIGVISSRGCPNACAFCANAAFWKKTLRLRSAENFIDEIAWLQKTYGYHGFDFWDDTITSKREHITGICEEILKRNLHIKWMALVRTNTLDRELLKLMKQAGCYGIKLGVESGSSKILNIIKKGIQIEQVRKVFRIAAEMGLLTKGFFMVSHPFETKEDLEATIDIMNELNGYNANIITSHAFTLIYPGTELEQIAKKQGILADNFSWNTYTEFPKAAIADCDRTTPYWENKNFKLEEIKSYLVKNLNIYSKKTIFKRIINKIKSIKSRNDIQSMIKLLFQYFKIK